MVPHTPPLQPAPLSAQVTAIFEVPVTVAANCLVLPTDTVALFGFTCTAAPFAAETLSAAVLLVVLPALLLTTTLYSAPLSEAVVGGVV